MEEEDRIYDFSMLCSTSAADASLRIQNKYLVSYANILKPFKLTGECCSVITVFFRDDSNIQTGSHYYANVKLLSHQ